MLTTNQCGKAAHPLPTIFDETDDFAVVFKPSRMHCAPLHGAMGRKGGDTLLDWYAGMCPPVMNISGKKAGEGGLLHRLDFETQGLVLFAKNQSAFDFLQALQEAENFIKEYSAICQKRTPHSSYPPPPEFSLQESFAIESYFRPFGPGRKQVRPVINIRGKDHSGLYRTEIVNIIENEHCAFTLRLKKGFRHQIRCHLAWIGCPVQNDPVYGESSTDGFLALRSHGLFFTDPRSGELREYHMEPLYSSG